MPKPNYKAKQKIKKGGAKHYKFKGKGKDKKFFKNRTEPLNSGSRLVIRNLSFKATPEALTDHFGVYGKVQFVNLLKRPNGELTGCGFVQFENHEDASRAKDATHNGAFLGRSINVDIAIPKTDYVANLNKDKSNNVEEVKEEEENNDVSHGNEEIESKEGRGERPSNFGFPKNKFGQEKYENKFKSSEKPLDDVDDAQSRDNKPKIKRKARLIVRNISFKATEESLKNHFQSYGEVIETTLLKKPNGLLVGCGFVQFQEVPEATKAILETNAKPFLGRPIHVDWAVAKNKYMSHIISKEDEKRFLENDVKIESDSDDEKPEIKVENIDLKKEEKDSDADSSEESDKDDDDEEDDTDVDDEEEAVEVKTEKPDLRVSANDAEDGKTIFIKNLPFDVTSDDLKVYAEKFGEVNYALVCVDKLTEHSKGTAFIRFKTKEDGDIFLSSGPEQLTLNDQLIQPMPAMLRDRMNKQGGSLKKQPKDSRNLYLVKEGVILANSKAATGVSASDMAKRLSLEQSKSQNLRNLNRFVSKYRLTIHNIPPHYTDDTLKDLCLQMSNVKPYCLKECKIMKHLKQPLSADGKYLSKGYGFVTFTKHEDALTCLRRLNNNPSAFGTNNRPIVSFSIEDKVAINARKKRLEKSKIKNPLHKRYMPAQEGEYSNKSDDKKFGNKRKRQDNDPNDNSYVKKKLKLEKNNAPTSNKKPFQLNNQDYSGESSKPGSVKFRSKFALREQAAMHKQNVKNDKKKRNNNLQKMKERIKQPPQKKNTGKKSKNRQDMQQKNDKSFSDLVNKYKSKLVAGQEVKSKWYEQS